MINEYFKLLIFNKAHIDSPNAHKQKPNHFIKSTESLRPKQLENHYSNQATTSGRNEMQSKCQHFHTYPYISQNNSVYF